MTAPANVVPEVPMTRHPDGRWRIGDVVAVFQHGVLVEYGTVVDTDCSTFCDVVWTSPRYTGRPKTASDLLVAA